MSRSFSILMMLACFATLAPFTAGAESSDDSGRLDRKVLPTAESVQLTLDARQPDYRGSVRIDLDVREATDTFRFHSEGSVLERVALSRNGQPVPTTYREVARGVVRMTAAHALKPGRYSLQVDFRNTFDTHGSGLYRLDVRGDAYAFTQFEANDAREAFPCWDEPDFRLPYRFTLTVPKEHLAVTNTPVESETVEGDMKTVVFRPTKSLSAYLLAIATGPFDTMEIEGMSVPGRVVTPRGQAHMAEYAARIAPVLLGGLEEWFGRPYPFAKLDLIAVPEYWYGAMENAGAIVFLDNGLLLPDDAGATQRRRVTSTLSHEMAHMWFGDLVTMEWWDDLWLNESFATWLGKKNADRLYPQFDIQLDAIGAVDRARLLDARLSTRVMRQPVETADNLQQMADALAYNKGHAVLAMFEQWLTPQVFQKGVRRYIEQNAWGNATANDLWKALSEVSGKDVGAAMGTFLDQAGMPLITVELLPGARAKLTQSRFLNAGLEAPPALWQVPITLRYSDGKHTLTTGVLLKEASETVALPGVKSVEWIYPNADEIGYFRWTLPAEALSVLAEHATETLTPRERRGFISNLSALLDAGQVHGDAFLAMLQRFSGDTEPTVIEALLDQLDKARDAFVTPDLEAAFARYVRRTLQAPVARFGLEVHAGETESTVLLRPKLLVSLADLGRDEVALGHGEALADAHMEDPDLVDPSLLEAALRVAAIRGDQARFVAFRTRFETTTRPTERADLLNALASFDDGALADSALAYCLAGPLRAQEIRRMAEAMWKVPRQRDRVFRWMTQHIDEITTRVPDIHQADLEAQLSIGCTRERYEATREFFEAPEHRPLGVEVAVRKANAVTLDCARLRERDHEAVEAYLNSFAATP